MKLRLIDRRSRRTLKLHFQHPTTNTLQPAQGRWRGSPHCRDLPSRGRRQERQQASVRALSSAKRTTRTACPRCGADGEPERRGKRASHSGCANLFHSAGEPVVNNSWKVNWHHGGLVQKNWHRYKVNTDNKPRSATLTQKSFGLSFSYWCDQRQAKFLTYKISTFTACAHAQSDIVVYISNMLRKLMISA